MTSYLARTETLKEEKDLRMFHPKEMQCDRRDEGDEQCKLTEERICSKAEGEHPANENSNNILNSNYESEENLENYHSEDFKIGTQKEKEEGYGLTDQSWVDDTDCTQLEGSPELCSETEEETHSHDEKDIPSPGFNNEEEFEDDERDCNQLESGSIVFNEVQVKTRTPRLNPLLMIQKSPNQAMAWSPTYLLPHLKIWTSILRSLKED